MKRALELAGLGLLAAAVVAFFAGAFWFVFFSPFYFL
jgi:hypothetical protein